jgi:hypothetical protein
MAATGYTPISLYYSTTAAAVPVNTNLANGELAINITDGKLYYKDNGGTVRLLASNATSAPVTTFSAGTTGFTPSSATSGAITLAGTLNVANGGTGLTTLTANYIPYGNGTSALNSSSTFTFNGTTLVSPAISLTASALTSSNTSNLAIGGTLGFSDTGIIAHSVASTNNYLQQVIQNTNSGASASAEFIAYNNNGTASTNYATVGINSSGYTGTGSINAAGYGYFLTGSTDLVIGTIGANALHMTINSSATDALSISSAGLINVNSNTAGTALLTITSSTTTPALKVPNIVETANTVAGAPASTQTFYLNLGAVQYYTSNAANNWTVNFAFSSGTSMNTALAVGDSVSLTMLATQGSTAYYNSAVQIDGVSVTPKWQGGSAPTSGNASGIDSYTYVIYKTASATYTVLASQTKFA